jgi:signal peptidase I
MAAPPESSPSPQLGANAKESAESAAAPVEEQARESRSPWWQRLWRSQRENVRVLAIALVIALVLRLWVAEPRFIPSNSMEPTLHIGDRLIVEKVSYHLHPPQPGDIVVFHPPEQLYPYGYSAQQAFIKRVVAVPGQTVTVTGQRVYVDGVPQTEPYIQAPPAYEMVPVRVPPGGRVCVGGQPQRQQRLPCVGHLAPGQHCRSRPDPLLAPGAVAMAHPLDSSRDWGRANLGP